MSGKVCPNCGNRLDTPACRTCGYSTVPKWIRLRHDSGMSMTFRDGATPVHRDLFHTYFRHIITTAGHPIAAYLPSDGSPFFTVECKDDGWFVAASTSHRNTMRVDGKMLAILQYPISDGSQLEIISGKDGCVVGVFTFSFT